MEDIEISLEQSDTKGRFYLSSKRVDGPELTFTKAGEGLMIIDHTEVPGAISGMGIGEALVQSAVDYARQENRKVVPLCPYAAHQFRKHTEWHDVLNK